MRLLFLFVIVSLSFVPRANADCTSGNNLVGPHTRTSWVEGGLVYDTTNKVLKTCDGTNWTTVNNTGNIPNASYYSETTVTVTPARGVWFDSSATITIPQTGTYQVSYSARFWCLASNDGWWASRLRNETANTIVASAFGLGVVPGGISSCQGDHNTGNGRISSFNQGDVLRIQYFLAGGGTSSVYYGGDANGGTSITAVRIGN